MSNHDTTASVRQSTALIVHAHPEPASFSSAQVREAEKALVEQGYQVRMIDLYQLSWDPMLDRDEFFTAEDYFKPQAEQLAAVANGTLSPEVDEHLQALLDADLLVLSFPLWWFSLPAILKG